jgi:hypothetical protein
VRPRLLDTVVEDRLDDALQLAGTGHPLIVRARRPETVDLLVRRASSGLQGFTTIPVEVEGGKPQELLLAAAAPYVTATTLLECLAARDLDYCMFIADLRGRDAASWLLLAGTFANARLRREDGPAFVLVTDGAQVPAGCSMVDDGDFIGPAEAAVFASSVRRQAGLLAASGDAAAIEVSRGDLDQLADLLGLADRDRFDPTPWVRQQTVSEAKLLWRGRDEVCATWLAHNNVRRLQQRVWRGQASVLFPWLAEGLRDFLDHHGHRLPAELSDPWSGNKIPRESFEWSNILYILNARRAGTYADCAYRLRALRNALAHQQPLTWIDAVRAENDLRMLLRWPS